MRIQYHEPLGECNNAQDPLPDNWQDLERNAKERPGNFGVVEPKKLYRSGIVWAHQVPGLQQKYGIENIVTLLDGDWLAQYYHDQAITIHQFPLLQRKELTFERIKDIVRTIDSLEAPSLVCCLRGVVRTGMVVAGYNIISQGKSNREAISASMFYGNFNMAALREISKYRA